jgi:spore germination protein KA
VFGPAAPRRINAGAGGNLKSRLQHLFIRRILPDLLRIRLRISRSICCSIFFRICCLNLPDLLTDLLPRLLEFVDALMGGFLLLNWLQGLFRRKKSGGAPRKRWSRVKPDPEDRTLARKLDDNKKVLREIFDHCDDLVTRDFTIGKESPVRALAAFLDPMVDPVQLNDFLLRPLMVNPRVQQEEITIAWLREQVIQAGQISEHDRWLEVANGIADGLVALFVDGQDRALVFTAIEDNSRSIEQPISESVARGPSEAFNEDGRTNLALVRKRLRTTRLAVERLEVGALSKTTVYVLYLKGYVYDGLPEEIMARLQRIKTAEVLGSGQIEELINDSPWSLFSGLDVSERPDRIVAALTAGKAALIFGVTPFAVIVPATLNSQLQSPEDHYNRFWFGSFTRLLRWAAFLSSILAPAFYVAITSYHQELIPTDLLMSLLATRAVIPFPVMLEAIVMLLGFELLQEAGIRLPKPFGQTIGVVGAILIGQIAVNAGLVSPSVVVVMAFTAISSYSMASLDVSTIVRVIRLGFVFAAGFLGLFGVLALLTMLGLQLCAQRSFGIPYLTPLAPLSLSDLKDSFIRAPAWMMKLRPKLTGQNELQRQHSDLKPGPPEYSPGRRSGRTSGRNSGQERG